MIFRRNPVIWGLLNYVEIKTKITSVFAFMMTIAYLLYKGQDIHILPTAVFLAGMFIFDLTTTAINNYIDSKSNDQVLPFKRNRALSIIYVLLVGSTALGIILVLLTDIVVLLLGGICFVAGVFYTYGPIPISRQPLGELFSGVFYGFFIPFLLLYINMPKGYYLGLGLGMDAITLELQVIPLITVILLSINPVCCTANIMLANNICDLEKDVKVKRYTLPYYLGKRALALYKWLYYIAYLSTVIMVSFKILHPICLIALATVVLVRKNIKIFLDKQEKSTTFLTSIKNYVIIMGSLTFTIFISFLIK